MFHDQRLEEALSSGRPLRREVLPPRSHTSNLGIVAVSAVAMLFAVASSLLLFHASTIHRYQPLRESWVRPRYHSVPPPSHGPRYEPPAIHAVEAPDATCRGPVYRARDGRAEAVFELCPPRGGAVKRVVDY